MDPVKSQQNTVKDVQSSFQHSPEDEIVISGIAGVFPKCANVHEFGEKLFAKEDLISETDHYYVNGETELQYKYGKLACDLKKFDAEYFKIMDRLADAMDPMGRLLLEKTYEAIVDAGLHPQSLRGTKTGIYVGSYNSESEMVWIFENKTANPFGFLGSSRFMLANRISFWLGTRGPSYNVDTACSSSFFALVNAYEDIRRGVCDAAIVAGCQLCLAPVMQETILAMGMFSPDGAPKCFDEGADGYCRAETVGVILLQKMKNAKRVYARLVHAKLNSNGNTTQNLWNTSIEGQQTLFREFYEECGINASAVDYVEAHSTGTREGDTVEISAIENVFCAERTQPLKIGSVKSNMGHSEAGSGMSAIAKLICGYEKGVMLPNIRLVKPRTDIKSLHEGRIVVVTEPIPWENDFAGINNFGLGGTNAHALFRSNPKEKKNGGLPEDDLPRLVVISGRTQEAIDSFLDFLDNKPIDSEFVRLLHDIHRSNFSGHSHRGYILLKKQGQYLRHSSEFKELEERPVWFVFSGMGSQWPTMGKELMALPVFAESIAKCDAVLKPHGVDLKAIITSSDPNVFDDVTNSFLGIAAIQIALVDVLSAIGVKADGMLGHSIGELGCAYADGCLTAEQTILTAYYRGKALQETNFIRGSMAAVGMGYDQILETLPAEFDVACHNSSDNCTVSAPAEEMQKFVDRLESEGVFVRIVNVSNVPFHSRYIASAGPKFLVEMKKLIPERRLRSPKWISTSNLEKDWEAEAVKYSCPEYYANNLLNPVYFDEACRHVPSNAIAIEIGPHGILQSILKRSLNQSIANIALMSRNHTDNTEFLLCALGTIFEAGLALELHKLYPHVEFPVSRGTPMIGPLVKWDHSKDFFVQEKMLSPYRAERDVIVTLADSECFYLRGHVIDGRNLYPAAGYLVLVWDTLVRLHKKMFNKTSVVFENVKFLRATVVPAQGEINFTVMIHRGSGNFEVSDQGVSVAVGRVAFLQKEERALPVEEIEEPDSSELPLNSVDVYKELRLRGYQYSGQFQGISRASLDGSVGKIKWMKNFVPFLDSLFQLPLLQGDSRSLFIPVELQKLSVDVDAHFEQLSRLSVENPEFTAHVRKDCKTIQCGGVFVENLKATSVARKKLHLDPTIEKVRFCPYTSTVATQQTGLDRKEVIATYGQIILHNYDVISLDVLEVLDDSPQCDQTLLSQVIREGFERALMSQNTTLVAKSPDDPRINEEIRKLVDISEQIPQHRTFSIILAPKILQKKKDLEECMNVVAQGGFLLTTDEINSNFSAPDGFTLCCEYHVQNEKILLLRKSVQDEAKISYATVQISNESFSWIVELQNLLRAEASENEKIVVYAQNEKFSGILGFINCLAKEIGLTRIRCFFVNDETAPPFCLQDPFYQSQLSKHLIINVYKNGVWGDYGHFPLDTVKNVRTTHAYVNTLINGDLSTLRWIEGPINPSTYKASENRKLIQVHYSSLNFRDVMLATGKLSASVVFKTRLEQENILGLEYSGTSLDANRYMGICGSKAMSSIVDGDECLMWPVPKSWSLEDAATVPVVYATVLYALFFCGHIKQGESILIHAGSGGVGQAAINICTFLKCKIFTTVGTEQKRRFIRETFPHIPESHIGDSRSTSFEYLVMKETNGKGVDLVLNSLAEEKLQASVRCLANRGRFLEIGLFDLAMNNSLGMGHFLKEISFQGVELANLFDADVSIKKLLRDKLQEFIDNGSVKPLTRTVFAAPEVEQAFRFMATGKHIGKVLLKIREEESDTCPAEPKECFVEAVPRYYASEHKSYVICGGLGGLGLELIDWLLIRGGRKFVISSRNGVKTGYQAWKIRHWKSYGATITISTDDATKPEGVKSILKKALALGPVAAIFNLAAVLEDALFDNQSEESFARCSSPKGQTCFHLDQLSRKMCPNLEHFVVFSSLTCGVGNAGQTNYGFANSIMERICEDRRSHNLPALAIQWGLIGEVGLAVKENDDDKPFIFAHLQEQPVVSYLQVLDMLLKQSNTIVGSKIRAEKRSKTEKTNIVATVASILGIKDVQKVDPNMPLVDYGIDSLTSVEIKQLIEMELNIFLTYQDIKTATFAKLYELQAANGKQRKNIKEIQPIVNPKISELRAELLDQKPQPSIV